MKITLQKCLAPALLATFLTVASIVSAQTTTTTTSSTTSVGTVSDFSPSVITVRSSSSTAPVGYSYSKTTTYVDENGNPVSVETIKSGMPVTVYYSQEGDKMVASKVVVKRTSTNSDGSETTVKEKTTTTNEQ